MVQLREKLPLIAKNGKAYLVSYQKDDSLSINNLNNDLKNTKSYTKKTKYGTEKVTEGSQNGIDYKFINENLNNKGKSLEMRKIQKEQSILQHNIQENMQQLQKQFNQQDRMFNKMQNEYQNLFDVN